MLHTLSCTDNTLAGYADTQAAYAEDETAICPVTGQDCPAVLPCITVATGFQKGHIHLYNNIDH